MIKTSSELPLRIAVSLRRGAEQTVLLQTVLTNLVVTLSLIVDKRLKKPWQDDETP